MTTYNTGNPVGSVDVRDLYDNAENLDKFTNGPLDEYSDRLGVSRQSLQGIRNASQYVRLGAYAAGLNFTAFNQVFSFDGEFYAPGPAITLPYTTTGAGAGEIANFRSVGDAILRQDLVNSTDPAKGAALVGYRGRTLYDKSGDTVSALDYPSMQDAVNAVADGGAILIPSDYAFTSEVSLAGKRNIKIYGYGAKLTAPSPRIRSLFDCSGSFGTVTFEGLRFDLSGSILPAYTVPDYPSLYSIGIFADGFESVTVINCEFTDLYTNSVKVVSGSSIGVYGCDFSSEITNNNQIFDFVSATTVASVYAQFNKFTGAAVAIPSHAPCGIFASGIRDKSVVSGNLFNYCGRDNTGAHRLGAIDFYHDAENVVVENNTALNCLAQFMRLSSCNNGLVHGNHVEMSGFAESLGTILSIEGFGFIGGVNNGTKNVTVSGNTFIDEFNRSSVAVGAYAYDWGLPTKGFFLTGNTFDGCNMYCKVFGPYNGITISNNTARGYRSAIQVFPTTGSVPVTSDFGDEVNSVIDGLLIENNYQLPVVVNSVPLISFDGLKAPVFTGQIRAVTIRGNQLSSPSASTQPAIYVRDGGSVRASEIIIDKNRSRFVDGLCTVQQVHAVQITSNTSSFSPSDVLKDASGIDVITRVGNSCTTALSGVLKSSAVLVAGSAVISTTESATQAKVTLSRQAAGGTLGHLSISAVSPGSGFTINSSSATDTSTIEWEIVK